MVGQLNDRVLLIEDEPLLRKLMSANLVAAGYLVRVAVDGLDALAKLRTGLPDMIVSDLHMPRMTGFEFLDVVRKRFPQIPVIVFSGEDEMPKGLPADGYVRKTPLGFEQLLECMADMARKSPQRSPAPQIDSEPALARWDGNGRYDLDCQDCLRIFSVPRARHARRDNQWITCVHCGSVVVFRVADGDSTLPAPPQFQEAQAVGVCHPQVMRPVNLAFD